VWDQLGEPSSARIALRKARSKAYLCGPWGENGPALVENHLTS
jgi:hypothetical protein